MKEVTATIESVLGGIASISLLVAGVGIINTMTVSVMERTREIGTMKAIGAKNLDVLVLFLSEATITGIIGGTIGASFGFMLSRIVSNMIGLRTEPTITLGAMVVGFAVVTSILSGLYPAWRASNLSPVEALRHE
jgi:putative ABC transport system permease protein